MVAGMPPPKILAHTGLGMIPILLPVLVAWGLYGLYLCSHSPTIVVRNVGELDGSAIYLLGETLILDLFESLSMSMEDWILHVCCHSTIL